MSPAAQSRYRHKCGKRASTRWLATSEPTCGLDLDLYRSSPEVHDEETYYGVRYCRNVCNRRGGIRPDVYIETRDTEDGADDESSQGQDRSDRDGGLQGRDDLHGQD